MGYELTGRLLAKYETIQRSETFRTREFVLEKKEDIGGRIISNYIKFQCVQEKTNIIDRVNIGDELKVYFNIKGSKWEKDGRTNYITNLDAWKLEHIVQPDKSKSTASKDGHLEPQDTFSTSSSETVDDLPF